MIADSKQFDLNQNTKLYILKSKKFKTDLISINFARPLSEKEAVCNTLITRILERGSKRYPDMISLSNHLDEMYGAVFVADATKYGEKHVMEFKIQFANQKHIDEDLTPSAIETIYEMIYHPLVEDQVFNRDFFGQEVKNLKDDIQSRINDKSHYAVERCIEIMCENEPFKVYQYGSVEELEKVTIEDLYTHYLDVLNNSKIDIIAIGDFDQDVLEKSFKDLFSKMNEKSVELPAEIIIDQVGSVKRVTEDFKVNQAKLSIGLRTGVTYFDDRYESVAVMSAVLGGGANSLLFRNVREKESLCYYIYSAIERYKGMIIISAGVDGDNLEKAERLIYENMDLLKSGSFSDEDLEIAKKSILSSIDALSDYPNSYSNYFYSMNLFNKAFDLDAFKDRINATTKEDVIASAKLLVVDTVYSIKTDDGSDA